MSLRGSHPVMWSCCRSSSDDPVRRGKAVPPSRCESCPANCRSSRKQSERFMEVTTWIEALRCQRTVLDGSASAQAVTLVNVRAGLEKTNAEADPPGFRGRQPAPGKRATRAPGVSAGALATACAQEDSLPFCQGQRGVFRLAEGMRYGRWLRPMTRRGRTGKWSEAGSLRGPARAPPEFFQAGGNLSTGRVQERVRGRCPAPAGYSVDEFPAGYS